MTRKVVFQKMEPEIKRIETNKLLILNTLYYKNDIPVLFVPKEAKLLKSTCY
ncbi:hypothetical protein Ga0451573_001268 [Peptococcaceae bacterium DYL19]|nr:hypothetical protein [Phosphitispora fastidiosa]